MRIAFFNWRDIRNPRAGGAEVYNHELLKRLAASGHKVTLFTSTFPGCRKKETIDGVEHVRYAGRFLMYPDSFFCYKKNIEGRYDVIIESINGVPFFTPLFAKEKVVSFIHQLTRQNWFSGIAFPLAFLGYHAEDHMLSLYRNNHSIVPSLSTKMDLSKLGYREITIIHGAAEIRKHDVPKEDAILYLGRLTRSKRVDHVLRSFRIIRKSMPGTKLWIAGSGPEEKSLRQLADDLGIEAEFFGHVSEHTKAELLSRARLVLFPAAREGWGLVVLEANCCGTPVIGYRVHGLKDSIIDGVNGRLVPEGDYVSMGKAAAQLLEDPGELERLSASALDNSRRYSWDSTAADFESLLKRAVG